MKFDRNRPLSITVEKAFTAAPDAWTSAIICVIGSVENRSVKAGSCIMIGSSGVGRVGVR